MLATDVRCATITISGLRTPVVRGRASSRTRMVWTLAGAARMVVPDPADPGDGVSKGGVRVEEETGVSPLCERKERETGQPCRIIASARHARWTANPETTFAVFSR